MTEGSGREKNPPVLKGTPVSPGIAMGRALLKDLDLGRVARRLLSPEGAEAELNRFRAAVEASQRELRDLRERFGSRVGEASARVFDTHDAYLRDPVFLADVETLILQERMNLEAAIAKVISDFDRIFKLVETEVLRERAVDLRDVAIRVLRNLAPDSGAPGAEERTILVARELSVVEMFAFPDRPFRGIVTEEGGLTSHAAILARSMRIPTVVGVKGLLASVKDGDLLVVDGAEGVVRVNPDERVRAEYGAALAAPPEERKTEDLVRTPTRTRDGTAVALLATCGNHSEVERAVANRMDGVGLYRTELLYLIDRRPPEEEALAAHLAGAAALIAPRAIAFRLLDLDSSARLEFLHPEKESNPALGVRSLRALFREPGLFRGLLRAILRASVGRDARVLVPFVTSVEEVRHVKEALFEERWDLRKQKVEARERLPVGAVLETPAAALGIRDLVREIDFLVVGLDNLIQYTLAADRGNEGVREAYHHLHPVVLRALRKIFEVAEAGEVEVALAGEVASDPAHLPLLLGAGARRFSIAPLHFPAFKQAILELDARECRRLATEAARCTSPGEVDLLLQRFRE